MICFSAGEESAPGWAVKTLSR